MPHKDKKKLAAYMREYMKRPDRRLKHKLYLRNRKRQLKLQLIALLGGHCADCGLAVHPAAFHFDHQDRTQKLDNLGHMMGYSWERIMAEAEKCELVCANCHAVRTWPDADKVGA